MSVNQNVAYKQSWRAEYLKRICGFANAQGRCWEAAGTSKRKEYQPLLMLANGSLNWLSLHGWQFRFSQRNLDWVVNNINARSSLCKEHIE
jgi:hypothetical protein